LDAAGHTSVPAQDPDVAAALIRDHKLPVDILIIDPFLPGAFEFISQLRGSRPRLKVLASIPTDYDRLPPLAEVDAVFRKPHRFTSLEMVQWMDLVQSLLSEDRYATPSMRQVRAKRIGRN